jgi:hypothetical protein
MRGDIFPDPPLRNKDILLPKLTFLCLIGPIAQLEVFFTVLMAPSLQELHIAPYYFLFRLRFAYHLSP